MKQIIHPCCRGYLWHGHTEDLLVAACGRVDAGDLVTIHAPDMQVGASTGGNVTLSQTHTHTECCIIYSRHLQFFKSSKNIPVLEETTWWFVSCRRWLVYGYNNIMHHPISHTTTGGKYTDLLNVHTISVQRLRKFEHSTNQLRGFMSVGL